MNLGDNLLLQNIALLNKLDAEESLMLMRYMFSKETTEEKKIAYLHFIDTLEAKLGSIYAQEVDDQLTDQETMRQKINTIQS